MGKGQAESGEDWLIRIKLAIPANKVLSRYLHGKAGKAVLNSGPKPGKKPGGTTFETKTDPLRFLSRFSPNQIGLFPAVICGHSPHLGVNPYSSKITSELLRQQGVIAITSHKLTFRERSSGSR